MILVDTSLWVDHLRAGTPALQRLLVRGEVLVHPWVVGELALGHLRERTQVLGLLVALPQAEIVTADELLAFIDRHDLAGRGIGYVDVHLLASVHLSPGARLWSRDRRVAAVAAELRVSVVEADLR